ncbi:hypothetical protein E8E13_003250 [Curvularia kusanoi]|uniref:BTB domain-containing protein n=1 Tax=Curvularia kusanoi TaxID=90978 RepID=A0A9P4W841_CURKU|nr:hypothetical protein E8E13_003250 [Curvularia kusanoi]
MTTTNRERTRLTQTIATRQGEAVTILAGPSHESFRVHKELLIEHSEFFKDAFKEPGEEAEEDLVRLQDIEPDIFHIFLYWMYFQELPGQSVENIAQFQMARVKAHIFGDRFIAHGFLKVVRYDFVDVMFEGQMLYCNTVIYGWNNLPSHDPLRELFVDLLVRDLCFADSNHPPEQLMKKLPKAFLLAFMIKVLEEEDEGVMAGNIGDRRGCVSRCEYHGHEYDEDFEECEYENSHNR